MDIANRLKQLRADRGYSLYYISKITGIAGQHVKGMEEGSRQPTIDTLQRLLTVYGLTLSEFFNENKNAYFPTDKERQLLENFRIMNDEKSEALLIMSEALKK